MVLGIVDRPRMGKKQALKMGTSNGFNHGRELVDERRRLPKERGEKVR